VANDPIANKPFVPANPAKRPGSFVVPKSPQSAQKPGDPSAPPGSNAPSPNAPWTPPKERAATNVGRSDSFGGPVVDRAANLGAPPATPHLTYFGGRVLTQPKVINVFVGDYWNTPAGQGDAAHMNGFVSSFGKAGLFDMLNREYGAGRPEFAGSVVVPGAVTQMQQADIQTAVQNALASNAVKAPNDQTIVAVHLPPQATLSDGSVTSQQGLGGYHGSFAGADGKQVYYAAIAYSDAQNGINFDGNPRDNNTTTLSHELVEAITDPNVAVAQTWGDIGWYDPLGGEIGDLAVNDGAVPLSQAFGRTPDGYAIQIQWDNKLGQFEADSGTRVAVGKTMGIATPNATLTATESQSKVTLTRDLNASKLLMDISLKNPNGVQPQLTLTAPDGTAIALPVPPVPDYHGTLDLSDLAQGISTKGDWFLSATDPTNGGVQLQSWTLTATGVANQKDGPQPPK
jgi:hypothetical protein